MRKTLLSTEADNNILECIQNKISFSVVAGAGSGKTTSLVEALRRIKELYGVKLNQNGQKVVCITYTNRAVDVISSRLGFNDLYYVSTLHGFLWSEISRFQEAMRCALLDWVIPKHIESAKKKDNGGNSQAARNAREKVARLEGQLEMLAEAVAIRYEETVVSDYAKCVINHDDVIEIAAYLISNKPALRKGLGQKYPFIFVDEAQDTFTNVVDALNAICSDEGLPIVGYFGDPMQQIYDGRAGMFAGPEGSISISKKENFRSATSVIKLLNNFREDLQQVAAGPNAHEAGSVEIKIVQAEEPSGYRNRYTPEQQDRAAEKFNLALEQWGWNDNPNVKQLFLSRQMIARRLGFSAFHRLFTGDYSSSSSQNNYEKGQHFLLKPFVDVISNLVKAKLDNNPRKVIEILRGSCPAFDPAGFNKNKSLKNMIDKANEHLDALLGLWYTENIREILNYCREHQLCQISERLAYQLDREARDAFDKENEDHVRQKSDWLADKFFDLSSRELHNYLDYLDEHSPFSTQHGVKGEEYENVLVVIDDIEASWNKYSFSKVLTPKTSGMPTEGQKDRTSKLAYVCFSRAERNLRIIFFSQDAIAAGDELVRRGLFQEYQVAY